MTPMRIKAIAGAGLTWRLRRTSRPHKILQKKIIYSTIKPIISQKKPFFNKFNLQYLKKPQIDSFQLAAFGILAVNCFGSVLNILEDHHQDLESCQFFLFHLFLVSQVCELCLFHRSLFCYVHLLVGYHVRTVSDPPKS